MALVTVQRSPSPSDVPDSSSSAPDDDTTELDQVDSSQKSPQRSQSLSESYLSFKGAAIILPQSECPRATTKGTNVDIQVHLQSMFCMLRPQDTIKMAIKLECKEETWIRYMAVVITEGVQDTEESLIIGVDIHQDKATVGLVLPIWGDTDIKLDGDGGFQISSNQTQFIFKPVSVQAMWSAWQCLSKIRDTAAANSYYPCGLTHTWIQFYGITSAQPQLNLWNQMDDLESQRPESMNNTSSTDTEDIEAKVRTKLREIMMTVDLEEVTTKLLRTKLEELLGMNLRDHRHFIDQEMIVILRQMDAPSQIFEYLYLGSEWNASNLEELQRNQIGYILNVTREIDNFFPGNFHYKNIRVYDVESSDLLRYWEETYKFINKARKNNSKVLVHCKMGVSRSASTVISFAMKDKGWSLDQAHSYVKSKRGVVKPNDGFMKQLKIYEGILGASNQRHNKLWRSPSLNDMEPGLMLEDQDESGQPLDGTHTAENVRRPSFRPRSWSAQDSPIHASSDDESSVDVSTDSSEPTQFMLETDSSCPSGEEQGSDIKTVKFISSQDKEANSQDMRTSVSEQDTGPEEEVEGRRVTAGYDASSLSAVQQAFLYNHETSVYDSDSIMHLHPDFISEHTLARRMRRLRMSHFQHQSTEMLSAKAGPGHRVKADNFWIRESSEDVITLEAPGESCTDDIITQTEPTTQTEDLATERKSDSELDETMLPYSKEAIPWSPGTVRRHAQDLECRMTTTDVPTPALPPTSPSALRKMKPADDSREEVKTSGNEPEDTDDQTQQPKELLKETRPEENYPEHSALGLSLAATIEPPSQQERPIVSQLSSTPPKARDPVLSGTLSVSPKESTVAAVCPDINVDPAPTTSSSQSLPQDSEKPDMAYNSEDIHMAPGHVLRTKLEIEQRDITGSSLDNSKSKGSQPVHRSSSCKESGSRNRFDRNSERRKTCLPVMQTKSTTDLHVGEHGSMSRSDTAIDKHQEKVFDIKAVSLSDFDDVKSQMTTNVDEDLPPIVLEEGELLIRQGSVQRTKLEMEQKFCTSPEKPINPKENLPAENVPVKVELEADESVTGKPRLRHSNSSPQLCLGSLAYPGEEDITWSVGTVRQHTQAFESIAHDKSPGRSSMSSLTTETLRMIREVGTAWSNSAKKARKTQTATTPVGHGMVRRLTYQIEGQSASKSIQEKLTRLKEKRKSSRQLNFDTEENIRPSKPIGRSASMRHNSSKVKKDIHCDHTFTDSHVSSRKVVERNLSLKDDTINLCLRQSGPSRTTSNTTVPCSEIPHATSPIDPAQSHTERRCELPRTNIENSQCITGEKDNSESNVKNLRGRFEAQAPDSETPPGTMCIAGDLHHTDDQLEQTDNVAQCSLKENTNPDGLQRTIKLNPELEKRAIQYLFSGSRTDEPSERADDDDKPVVTSTPNPSSSATQVITLAVSLDHEAGPVDTCTVSDQAHTQIVHQSVANSPPPASQLDHQSLKTLSLSPPKLPGQGMPDSKPDNTGDQIKVRRLHGKSHPLTKLSNQLGESGIVTTSQGRTNNPIYNSI